MARRPPPVDDAGPSGVGAAGSRTAPVRTCVGCRQRAGRAEVLRVVAVDGGLVVDPARRHPGRGASLHRDLGCLELAERRRAFPRALRVDGPLDVTPVRALLAST